TAADYVFILDPWWNPAVEAQAVDRAHRIGQQRHVFAYRLICRDTVEERIVELQQKKRKLADAIVTADSSLVSSLSAEDLKLLLSWRRIRSGGPGNAGGPDRLRRFARVCRVRTAVSRRPVTATNAKSDRVVAVFPALPADPAGRSLRE